MVSIIIPTYNEVKNLPLLIEEIFSVIDKKKIDIEFIIVDDHSPDGTGEVADELGKRFPVKVIHRKSKLGLGSAVREGFKLSTRSIVGVMDADLSHDPHILNECINSVGKYDIVIGSRFTVGSTVEQWVWWRKILSTIGVGLTRWLACGVRDPLSGYFFIKRTVIEKVELETVGYKILFEILVKGVWKKVKEVPYQFRIRKYSSSKLNWHEHWLFVKQIIDFTIYKLTHKKFRTMWRQWKEEIMKYKHILALTFVAIVVLCYHVSARTLWMDETAGLLYLRLSPLGFIFEYFRHPDNHPPLYYFLVLLTSKIFPISVFTIRLVSIISGVGLVVMNYLIGKEMLQDKKQALQIGFFTAFSSFFVLYSQMARYHSLAALITLCFFYLVYKLLSEGYTKKIFRGYIFFLILIGYTDYPHFIYALFIANGFYLYRLVRRHPITSIKRWVIGHLIAGFMCLPMIWFVYARIVIEGDHELGLSNLLGNSHLNFIAGLLMHPYSYFFGENIFPWNYVIFPIGCIVMIGSIYGMYRLYKERKIDFARFFVIFLCISLIIGNTTFFNIVDPRYNFIVYPKYSMGAFPFWIMLLVVGLSGIRSPKVRRILLICWLLVEAVGLNNFYQVKNYLNASYFNTFSGLEFVEKNAQEGDYLAITGDANEGVYTLYQHSYFKKLLPLSQDKQGELAVVPVGSRVWFFITASDDTNQSVGTDKKIPSGYVISNRFDSVPLDPTLKKFKEEILHRPSYTYKYTIFLLRKI